MGRAGNFLNKTLPLLFLALLLAGACKQKDKPAVTTPPEVVKVSPPEFDADSAYAYVERQVAFGPRVPGTEPHAECVSWLVSTLERFADTAFIQHFRTKLYNNTVIDGKNIVASFNPELKNRILLCAHYDTRPYADHDEDETNYRKPIPGANDGGSGTGVLLEIARQLSRKPLEGKGIDILLFDLEDWGEPQFETVGADDSWALGAQHWARNPHIPGYRARYGILFDMVGAEGAVFTMEGTSMFYAADIMRKVWETAHSTGYGHFFSYKETGAITDDHLYINRIAGIPTINIIHYNPSSYSGFFPHWHTLDDDMEHISRETLKAAGQVGLNHLFW